MQTETDRRGSSDPTPTVSVLVATRNHERTLGAMVEAVMGQTVEGGLELIVIDDGSGDGTPELLQRLAAGARWPLVQVRLPDSQGPARARNLGLDRARGRFIAITDSDCVPAPGWLQEALAAFSSPEVGVVQGRVAAISAAAPLFSHYIETPEFDGTFCTSNVVYRREALAGLRFDHGCWYSGRLAGFLLTKSPPIGEDVDLGMRVLAAGWQARFCAEALVHHQVIPISPWRWLTWPLRYGCFPARVARYPQARRHLFLGVWVSPLQLAFEVALLGGLLALWRPFALVLALPYLVLFLRQRGLRGRFPPAKAAAHLGWDLVAFASLLLGSLRYRAVVL